MSLEEKEDFESMILRELREFFKKEVLSPAFPPEKAEETAENTSENSLNNEI